MYNHRCPNCSSFGTLKEVRDVMGNITGLLEFYCYDCKFHNMYPDC